MQLRAAARHPQAARCALPPAGQISTIGNQSAPRCAQVCYSAQVDQMHRETIAEGRGCGERKGGSKEQATASRQSRAMSFHWVMNARAPFTACHTPP